MKHQTWRLLKLIQFLENPVGIVARTEDFLIHGVTKKCPVKLEPGPTTIIVHPHQTLHTTATSALTNARTEVKNIIGVIRIAAFGGTARQESYTRKR